jgi:lysozyme
MTKDRVLIAAAAAGFAMAGALLVKWEGTEYKAYLDTGNVPTICYGHTKGVKLGDVATEAQCREYLAYDMAEAEAIVNKCVKVPLGKNHKAVWISFAFNLGEGRVGTPERKWKDGKDGFCVLKDGREPTFLRKLNAGDYLGACDQLKYWVYDNGMKIRGLMNRRDDEFRLCTKIDFSLVYSGVTFTQH